MIKTNLWRSLENRIELHSKSTLEKTPEVYFEIIIIIIISWVYLKRMDHN